MIYTGGRRQGYLQAALITRAKGLKGHVVLRVLGDDPDRLSRLPGLSIWRAGGFEEIAMEDVRVGNDVVVKLKGVDDRDAAEALRGEKLYLSPAQQPQLPQGSYFIADLIGCAVETDAGQPLGDLREVQSHGAADVYVVALAAGGDLLFPALKRVLKAVDIEARRIVLDAAALEEVAVYAD